MKGSHNGCAGPKPAPHTHLLHEGRYPSVSLVNGYLYPAPGAYSEELEDMLGARCERSRPRGCPGEDAGGELGTSDGKTAINDSTEASWFSDNFTECFRIQLAFPTLMTVLHGRAAQPSGRFPQHVTMGAYEGPA